MGVPGLKNSFYPLLYNLASPTRGYFQQAVTAISPFSLFAFVICSPDKDDGVREILKKHFCYLDVATADRLLFYAPIDEPEEWRQQRQSERVAKSVLAFHDLIRDSCQSPDPGGTEHALATTLGIGLDELPAIILTTDPRSREYGALRTAKELVREQLIGLGNLAQDIAPIRDRGSDLAGYRKVVLKGLGDEWVWDATGRVGERYGRI